MWLGHVVGIRFLIGQAGRLAGRLADWAGTCRHRIVVPVRQQVWRQQRHSSEDNSDTRLEACNSDTDLATFKTGKFTYTHSGT